MAETDRLAHNRPWLLAAVVAVVALALGGGSYWAVTAGGSPAPAATATPTATATLTASATAHPSLHPAISCPGGPRYHLNIQKLQAQSTITEAVVTEINERKIRLELEGVDFTIDGWGELIRIGGYGNPSNELLDKVVSAVDAVAYEC